MVDTNFDTESVRRGEITGVVRRRRWRVEEKGQIVAEAVAPDAVIAEVARRHDLAPQHLSNWIKAAKDGRLVLPGDDLPAFVPVVAVEPAGKPAHKRRPAAIEIVMGDIMMRVPAGTHGRDVEAVLRAVRRCGA
jgi:transposase